jgi:hypothetical protein
LYDLTKDRDIRTKPEWIQFSAAAAVLAAGVLVYLLDRPSETVYFVPDAWRASQSTPSFFGTLGLYFPTFSHTFAFILFTTAVIGMRGRAAMVACLGWLAIDSLLEIAQSDGVANTIVPYLPGWFLDWPLLENFRAYFLLGRFDPLDLVSILIASFLAYLLILFSNRRGAMHAQ